MFDILNINGYIQVRDEHNETEQSAPSERRSFLWRQWRLIAEFLVLAIVSGCFLWIRENQLQTTKPLSASQVPFEQVRFNGTFGLESAFTGVGPDVDAAWDEITGARKGSASFAFNGAFIIPRVQWESINSHSTYPVKISSHDSEEQYIASLDVFHQLHCLDLLRKSVHRNYYFPNSSLSSGLRDDMSGHSMHCVEMLRQTLMCHGDMSLVTYNWVRGREAPFANFNGVHQCRNWEGLKEWMEERDVMIEKGENEWSLVGRNGLEGLEKPP